MRKFMLLATATVLSVAIFTGCSKKDDSGVQQQGMMKDGMMQDGTMMQDGMMMQDKHFSNDQLNSANRNKGNNLIGNHKNYRMEMSKEIADKIVKDAKVNSAYVMLTDNNAYVAVMMDENNNNTAMNKNDNNAAMNKNNNNAAKDSISDEVKQKVTKVVKKEQPKIENVYVSTNPDFVGRMQGYMNDVAAGNPITGFISEFNEMVDRVFPAVTTDTKDFKGLTQENGRKMQK
ncbi:YhcN/YlaJ family sporulation lipoprotein [Paenibacillus yanchengensis]|uniref:YhcN/YlaJ family sporulation lipoprotein n=1 Tax=Paenibacillus yanchengensis TaxID=2035833 RepID=A0ABW4YQH9_9BACL